MVERPVIIPAYRGEFGLEVRFQVPVVYAMNEHPIVEIEEGKEALYPRAKEWRIVPRIPETTIEASRARGRIGRPKISGPEKRFRPHPHVDQSVPIYDVVITPRKRAYGDSKNWPHWGHLVRRLQEAGLSVFAAGVADASFTDLGVPAAWDYRRPLDAAISAMRWSRVVVAACSGLAHLAVLCGSPMVLFTYRGMVAPGPVVNSAGRFVQQDYWPVRMKEYYHAANHTGAPIHEIDGWEWPDRVADFTIEQVS